MNTTFYIKRNDNDIVHYGVLGMKWGVRRYQNENGILTNAGRKKYLKDLGKERRKKYLELKEKSKRNLTDIRENTQRNAEYKREHDKIETEYHRRRIESSRNEKEKYKEYDLATNRDYVSEGTRKNILNDMKKTEGTDYVNNFLKKQDNDFTRKNVAATTATAAIGISALVGMGILIAKNK